MRKKVGIRELKNELTAIIRRVGEERVEYTVTVHGRPVAVLRPLSAADAAEHAADEVQAELAAIVELARQISATIGRLQKVQSKHWSGCARSPHGGD